MRCLVGYKENRFSKLAMIRKAEFQFPGAIPRQTQGFIVRLSGQIVYNKPKIVTKLKARMLVKMDLPRIIFSILDHSVVQLITRALKSILKFAKLQSLGGKYSHAKWENFIYFFITCVNSYNQLSYNFHMYYKFASFKDISHIFRILQHFTRKQLQFY